MNFRTSLQCLATDLRGMGCSAAAARNVYDTMCSVGSHEAVQVLADNWSGVARPFPAEAGLVLTRMKNEAGGRKWLVASDAEFFAASCAWIADPPLLFLVETDDYQDSGSGATLNVDLQHWLDALQLEFTVVEEVHQLGSSSAPQCNVYWCSPVATVALSFRRQSDRDIVRDHLILSRAISHKLQRPLKAGELLELKGWFQKHGGLEQGTLKAAREFEPAPNRFPMRLLWSRDPLHDAPAMKRLLAELELAGFGAAK